jgi:lysophospholipase L1-like esterase
MAARSPAAAVVAAVAWAPVAWAAVACADADHPGPSPIGSGAGYVALGSSFAAGPGLEPVADEPCFRSARNYPARVADALDLALTDVTCTGASIDVMPVQVESVTADTRLVTVTLGGNDVGYAAALDEYACLDIGLCTDAAVDSASVQARLAAVAGRLSDTLATVRERAPEARIVLVGYPRIVPSGGEVCPDMPLTGEHAAFAADVGERLDAALRDAASTAGADFVDVYAASSERGVCEPDDPWVGGLPPGTAPSGSFAFHPTPEGAHATAELIVAAVR